MYRDFFATLLSGIVGCAVSLPLLMHVFKLPVNELFLRQLTLAEFVGSFILMGLAITLTIGVVRFFIGWPNSKE